MKSIYLLAICALAATAQSKNPLTDTIKSRYEGVKLNLVETAEVMPEENYSYKLSAPQRSFGEWIGHTAMGNYFFCSNIKGEKLPPQPRSKVVETKEQLVTKLKESFTYCDGVLAAMDDTKMLAPREANGKTTYAVETAISMIGGLNEHYGNLVGYLRTKAVTPPSTARVAKRAAEAKASEPKAAEPK